jgi:hypothetical protein
VLCLVTWCACAPAHHVTRNCEQIILTLSNPIFCHPHTPQLLSILGGKEVGGLLVIILVLKEKNINRNRKSTTCSICWLKSVLHEEKSREQENHYDFPVPDAFNRVVRTLANR